MNKILVVDDQEQNLYLLKSLLQGHGYAVVEALNGAQALEIARATAPDMIVSDILMPVMDGFSLCQEWMKDSQLKSIPFVFYTATYTDPKDEQFALSLGAARFIVKPVETEQFVAILDQVFASAERGALSPAAEAAPADMTYYRMYNEVLVRKLEDKMLELEEANRALQEDITRRREAEDGLRRQFERLKALHTIDMAIAGNFEIHSILDIVLEQVSLQLGADACAVLLFHPLSRAIEFAAGRGFSSAVIPGTRLELGEGYAGRIARAEQIVHLSNAGLDGDQWAGNFLHDHEPFAEYFAVPLLVKGEAKGVIEIYRHAPLAADPEWLNYLETLAGQAAIAIDNLQLFNGLQDSHTSLGRAYDATIEGWSRAMDLRDKETEGHTQRVTELTVRLAREMGIPDPEIKNIRRGGLLHDIGKLGVPDNLLFKTEPLTDDELSIMRRHPTYAYEMLVSIEYLKPALDIPYCHHEKWDGNGYPRGLKGEQIPFAARIFAVVDVWDALTSDRPYRPAWTREQALKYIREQSGSYFDPQVVEAFLKLI